MRRQPAALAVCLLLAYSGQARQEQTLCGTYREGWKVEQHLHRQSERVRRFARTASPRSAARDLGNIALLDDSNRVGARRNPFALGQQTLTFTPTTVASTNPH